MKLGRYFIFGLNEPKLLALVNHHYDVLQKANSKRILNLSELSFVPDVQLFRINEITLDELRDSAVAYLAG